ncbi:MAG: caspase family protein [Deltaproteobacteria bacterium]|nr:caspase family protein [Deltaproteobacteria bacterium]
MLAVMAMALVWICAAPARATPDLGTRPPDPRAPALWAVLIGVAEAVDASLPVVPNAPADAERLRELFTGPLGVPADRVVLLGDRGEPFFDPRRPQAVAVATLRNVRLALGSWLAARVRPGDVVVVAWSGAGVGRPSGPVLVTADASADDLVGTGLPLGELVKVLAGLDAATHLWLDVGFDGAPARLAPPGKRGEVWSAIDPERGGPRGEAAPHGAFTAALAKALGEAPSSADLIFAKVRDQLTAAGLRAPTRLGRAPRWLPPRAKRERPELVLQAPHLGGISHAAFDPDGRRFATGGTDQVVKIWSIATRSVLANLEVSGLPLFLEWSPDGKSLFAGTDQGVSIWTASGRLLWGERDAAWARDVRDQRGGLLDFWQAFTWSPDASMVAIPRWNGPVELRAAADGRVIATLAEPGRGPLVWDPRGRFAVRAARDRGVWVYPWVGEPLGSARPGHFSKARRAHFDERVTMLMLSPDGRWLAAALPGGSGDFPPREARLLEMRPNLDLVERRLPEAAIVHLTFAFSEDSRTLGLSGTRGATFVDLPAGQDEPRMRRWDRRDAAGLIKFPRGANAGRVAVYMADDTRIFDFATAELVATLPGEAIAVTSDLSGALAGSSSNWGTDLRFREAAHPGDGVPIKAAARPIESLALVAGRRLVAHLRQVPAPIAWDLVTGQIDATPTSPSPTPGVTSAPSAPFDPRVAGWPGARVLGLDAGRVVLAGRDAERGRVMVWNVQKNLAELVLERHRGEVTALLLSPDGKTALTASEDTTLGVWDVATRRRLATVAVLGEAAGDAGRWAWVVTTPDGLFDGSPEGQAKMQWRVGDALVRLEQFSADFFTPGLLARLWEGARPRAATAIEELKPPPRVIIASPSRGAEVPRGVAEVVVDVEDAGGGVTGPWLYLNGRRVPAPSGERGFKGFGAKRGGVRFQVELVEGDNHLRATAFSADGAVESAGDEIVVRWSEPATERPVLHLLAVGVDAYQDPALQLGFAVADARAIASAFTPGLFGEVRPTLLTDTQATRANIEAALATLARTARPRDAVVVYLAGHGVLVGQAFYYLPWDAKVQSDADIASTGLSQTALGDALAKIPATKQVVILDACHSGAAAATLGRMVAERDAVGLARAQRRLAKASGVFLLAAATAAQKAKEIAALGHGVLTYAILSGLGQGRAAGPDGLITANGLLAFVDGEVPHLTERFTGQAQNTVQSSTGQDFPLARAR